MILVDNEKYLQETKMLDFSHPSIKKLIEDRGWLELSEKAVIGEIYSFVRDEILFGYNVSDYLKASEVLKDGFGQCNTKSTLFMALLRGCGIPCRIHGFTINKKLQEGAMTGIVYKNAPLNIFHTWTEVWHNGRWYELEGIILDKQYLNSLHQILPNQYGEFLAYGVGVSAFENIQVDWNECDTYIQSRGINQDFGVYACPDELLIEHHQEMSFFKDFLYRHIGRRLMNRNIKRIREC